MVPDNWGLILLLLVVQKLLGLSPVEELADYIVEASLFPIDSWGMTVRRTFIFGEWEESFAGWVVALGFMGCT